MGSFFTIGKNEASEQMARVSYDSFVLNYLNTDGMSEGFMRDAYRMYCKGYASV
jgi:hypothetical protein